MTSRRARSIACGVTIGVVGDGGGGGNDDDDADPAAAVPAYN